MNMITSIVDRELLTINSSLNIIWTPIDNKYFTKFIENLNHKIIDINDLYFGNISPNIIICNNKLLFHDKVYELSIRYHIPTIVVDHVIKMDIYDNNKLSLINDFPCSYHIALNQEIHDSWNKYHDQVLGYDIKEEQNVLTWRNLLYQNSKKIFTYE